MLTYNRKKRVIRLLLAVLMKLFKLFRRPITTNLDNISRRNLMMILHLSLTFLLILLDIVLILNIIK